LEEVENALTAYAEEQLRRERLQEAVDAAQRAVDLAQDHYTTGLVDFSNVLDALRSFYKTATPADKKACNRRSK
jgi:outer membrane protein TolC